MDPLMALAWANTQEQFTLKSIDTLVCMAYAKHSLRLSASLKAVSYFRLKIVIDWYATSLNELRVQI